MPLIWAVREVAGLRGRPGPARHALAAITGSFAPNAFLRLADNTVTFIAKHLEMGQGSYTGLATVLADELDADWAQIYVESAPANAKLYNLVFGAIRGTGGSTAARIPGRSCARPGRRHARCWSPPRRPNGTSPREISVDRGWSIARSRGLK